MRRALALLIAVLPAALAAAGPAAADWLRTRDGALVETRGPWKVRGALVIFTAPNGTLSSLRVSEVDLDASAVATMAARSPPSPAAEEASRKAVLEITMNDVRRAAPPASVAEEAPAVAPAAGAPVQVIAWRPAEGPDGSFEILGTLRNQGREIVTDLGVTVRLRDESGAEVGTANAFLGAASLAPGAVTTLRALFPDAGTFGGEPSFEVRARGIRIEGVVGSGESAPAEGSGEER